MAVVKVEAVEVPLTTTEDMDIPSDVLLTNVILSSVEMVLVVEQWMLDDVEDEAAKSWEDAASCKIQ